MDPRSICSWFSLVEYCQLRTTDDLNYNRLSLGSTRFNYLGKLEHKLSGNLANFELKWPLSTKNTHFHHFGTYLDQKPRIQCVEEFHFRWLKFNGIHASFPILVALISNHLKWTFPEFVFIPPFLPHYAYASHLRFQKLKISLLENKIFLENVQFFYFSRSFVFNESLFINAKVCLLWLLIFLLDIKDKYYEV